MIWKNQEGNLFKKLWYSLSWYGRRMMDNSHLSVYLILKDGRDISKLRVWVSRFFDIITYGFHLRACNITLWASILPQELFLTQLLKNEHSSLSIYRFEKHVSKRNFWWKSQKCGHFLSSSTHDKEIADQSSPSSSNAQRITFFFDIGLIWFKSVRRTFCRQFQKSPYLVPISSHSWDILKSNFSPLYLKNNQNGPSQATLQTKISHFIFKEQKKFLIYLRSFKSCRALESAILSWDTLYRLQSTSKYNRVRPISGTLFIAECQNWSPSLTGRWSLWKSFVFFFYVFSRLLQA